MADSNHFNQMADLTDVQLINLVKSNHSNAFVELAARYLLLVKVKASRFRNPMHTSLNTAKSLRN